MNKRGGKGVGFWLGVVAMIILITAFMGYSLKEMEAATEKYKNAEPISFTDVLTLEQVRFLDYIFGKIPGYLIGFGEEAEDFLNTSSEDLRVKQIGAMVMTIAIWFLFMLIFSDILKTFGFFSDKVSWLAAIIFAILAANVEAVQYLVFLGLGFSAIFGTFSITISIIWVFVFFCIATYGVGSD